MHHSPATSVPITNAQPHSHALLNRVIPVILRSPFHGLLSRHLLLITVTGRKTGRVFTIPVTYLQRGERLVVFSDQRWWRNLRGGATVTLRLRGRALVASAEVVEDRATVEHEVRGFLARKGRWAASMVNVTLDRHQTPTAEGLALATRSHVVIYLTPHE